MQNEPITDEELESTLQSVVSAFRENQYTAQTAMYLLCLLSDAYSHDDEGAIGVLREGGYID